MLVFGCLDCWDDYLPDVEGDDVVNLPGCYIGKMTVAGTAHIPGFLAGGFWLKESEDGPDVFCTHIARHKAPWES